MDGFATNYKIVHQGKIVACFRRDQSIYQTGPTVDHKPNHYKKATLINAL